MKHMKSLHLQSPWMVQSVSDRTGRRMLSISNNSTRYRVRRRIVGQENNTLRLAVKSEPEELTAFEPVIRVRS
jgi:hypothetical protein